MKFQTFDPKLVVSSTAKQAEYQLNNTGIIESQLSMLSKLQLSQENHYELAEHAKTCGVKMMSTGFDLPSVNFLHTFNFDLIKVPSGEITNLPYLRLIASYKKPILLSTGMSNLAEIDAALKVIESNGATRDQVTLLHCTSEYPAPYDEVNLLAMHTLRQNFGINVGYSDHTEGIEVSIAAVALGASVIEKHFTLSRDLPGPDHKASIEPDQLNQLVSSIRNVELSIGSGVKHVMPSELKNLDVVRKSLVASEKIKKGEFFTDNNIGVKRPGTGISPMRYDEFIGTTANKDYEIDDLLDLDDDR